MSPDRQKMLSFAPCVTSRANSIKIPSKEERWNCVMVVAALNLVMILSRGKWSCKCEHYDKFLTKHKILISPPPFPLPPFSTSPCILNSVAIVNKAVIYSIFAPPLPSLILFSYNWRGLCVLSHTVPSEIGIYFSWGLFWYLSLCVASRAFGTGAPWMAVVSIGPLNLASGSVAPGKAKVTAVTSWGMLRDGLLSLVLTYGAQKYLYAWGCGC